MRQGSPQLLTKIGWCDVRDDSEQWLTSRRMVYADGMRVLVGAEGEFTPEAGRSYSVFLYIASYPLRRSPRPRWAWARSTGRRTARAARSVTVKR